MGTKEQGSSAERSVTTGIQKAIELFGVLAGLAAKQHIYSGRRLDGNRSFPDEANRQQLF